MELFNNLKFKVVCHNIKVTFPETTDPKISGVAARLKSDELVEPILTGDPTDITNAAMARGINTSDFIIISPSGYEKWDGMAETFVERRNGKATREDAEKILRDANYFGTILAYMGTADDMVSGATHSTGDTARPALRTIKIKPDISHASDALLTIRGRDQEGYLFLSCAIDVNPATQELAGIAADSAKTAELFDIEPKVSLLSFSTRGPAKAPEVTKVAEVIKVAQELVPEYAIDGESQFDVSYVSSAAQLKAPNSKVAGKVTVFIFPDLQLGNIGRKIVQRLGNFGTIGPTSQGLNKPAFDLSRGANEGDVYKLSIITAAQTSMND